jgi:hypothetical protein
VRHLGSFLLAAVFGPAIFLLTGTGLSAFESARRHAFVDDPLSPLAALGALLLAGLLYGILVMVRLSPLGPGLLGMVLFGLSTWALVAPTAYETSFETLNVHMGGAVGQMGLGFLLGVPLLATLTSPRRWRSVAPTYYPGPYPAAYQPPAPSTLDATRQMPPQPAYLTLPDIAPPSLRYPASIPPAAPPAAPPVAPPAAPWTPAPATPWTPTPPPTPPATPQAAPPAAPVFKPAAPPAAPVAKPAGVSTSDDDEKTVRIVLDGDEPTVKLEP